MRQQTFAWIADTGEANLINHLIGNAFDKMEMKKKHYNFCLILLLILIGCKERFEPNLPIVPQGYLVVEGFINAQGPTQIKLSRTIQLDQKNIFKAELNASIKIESEDNSSFTLSAMAGGLYSGTASINTQSRYRLRIKTKDTKEY